MALKEIKVPVKDTVFLGIANRCVLDFVSELTTLY
jgi:hypothetical protein